MTLSAGVIAWSISRTWRSGVQPNQFRLPHSFPRWVGAGTRRTDS